MGQCRIRKDLLKGLMSTPEYESSKRLKQIIKKSLYQTEKASFNSLEWCQNMMQTKGVKAIKWNYSNQKPKFVTVFLSKSKRSIFYKVDPS